MWSSVVYNNCPNARLSVAVVCRLNPAIYCMSLPETAKNTSAFHSDRWLWTEVSHLFASIYFPTLIFVF